MTPEQKEENYRIAEQLLAEQSFRNGLVMGLLATGLMIALWIAMAAGAGNIFGFMAIAMGAGIGYVIQVFGKGLEGRFVVVAMILALAGCLAGSILAAVFVEAIDHQMPVMEILEVLNVRAVVDFIGVDFGLIDLMFWIVAISAAGYLAKRRLTKREQLAMFTHRYTPRMKTGMN